MSLDYRDVRCRARAILGADVDESDLDWFFCEACGVRRSGLVSLKDLNSEQADKVLDFCERRASGRPVQHILGEWNFYGYDLETSADALIPRPETETLVRTALEEYARLRRAENPVSILDLCTGSGCIACVLACESAASITASDVSEKALALAGRNAVRLGARERINFKISDMYTNIEGKFDIIVSNPPYIPTGDIDGLQREVKDFEPHIALDGGEDGLDFYREIARRADDFLNDDGVVIVEVGINQAAEVAALFAAAGYDTRAVKDAEGVDRVIAAMRTERQVKNV